MQRGLERALAAGRRHGFSSVSFGGVRFSHEQDLSQETRGCSSRHESDDVCHTRHAPDAGARQVPAPTPAQVARRERKDHDFHSKQAARRHRLARVWLGFRAALAMQRSRPDPGFAVQYEVPTAPVPPPPASVVAVGVAGSAAQRARAELQLRQCPVELTLLPPPDAEMPLPSVAGKRGGGDRPLSSSGGDSSHAADAGRPSALARRGGASRKQAKQQRQGGKQGRWGAQHGGYMAPRGVDPLAHACELEERFSRQAAEAQRHPWSDNACSGALPWGH